MDFIGNRRKMLALNRTLLLLKSSTLIYNGRQACGDQRSIRVVGLAETYTESDEFDASCASPKESPKRLDLVTCIVIQVIPGTLRRPESWNC